jgi:hypothetical protein
LTELSDDFLSEIERMNERGVNAAETEVTEATELTAELPDDGMCQLEMMISEGFICLLKKDSV